MSFEPAIHGRLAKQRQKQTARYGPQKEQQLAQAPPSPTRRRRPAHHGDGDGDGDIPPVGGWRLAAGDWRPATSGWSSRSSTRAAAQPTQLSKCTQQSPTRPSDADHLQRVAEANLTRARKHLSTLRFVCRFNRFSPRAGPLRRAKQALLAHTPGLTNLAPWPSWSPVSRVRAQLRTNALLQLPPPPELLSARTACIPRRPVGQHRLSQNDERGVTSRSWPEQSASQPNGDGPMSVSERSLKLRSKRWLPAATRVTHGASHSITVMGSTAESLTQKWLRQNTQSYPHADVVYTHVDNALARYPSVRPKTDVYSSVPAVQNDCLSALMPLQHTMTAGRSCCSAFTACCPSPTVASRTTSPLPFG